MNAHKMTPLVVALVLGLFGIMAQAVEATGGTVTKYVDNEGQMDCGGQRKSQNVVAK